MANITGILVEDHYPPIQSEGYNSNKSIKLGGTASIDMSASSGTFKGPTGGFTQNGAVTSSSPSAGVGYSTGAGGTVTQATNRTTGVTLNTVTGQITTNNASLAAETAAAFTVTDSSVAIGDIPVLAQQSGSNGGNTDLAVTAVAAGSFQIKVINNNASGGTAETGAIIINFAIIKGASS